MSEYVIEKKQGSREAVKQKEARKQGSKRTQGRKEARAGAGVPVAREVRSDAGPRLDARHEAA